MTCRTEQVILFSVVAGWSSQVARRAHNPKVLGSNPSPAIRKNRGLSEKLSPLLHTPSVSGSVLLPRLKSKKTALEVVTVEKEEDYFIPPLAPYVQWVRAYNQLVSLIYDEHKTVAKAWNAFRSAVPGIERRLEFGVFEQILLFSLFLSEWNKSEEAAPSRKAALPGVSDERLEQVIQKLRETVEERDSALWNIKNYEQDALALKERNERLEKQVADFDRAITNLRNDLGGANTHLNRVIQELDTNCAQIVSLGEENAALKIEKAFLEQQIEELREKKERAASSFTPASRIAAVNTPDLLDGPLQAVIQWPNHSATEKVIQTRKESASLKIGRWNVQLSKDGYYRLFRKIRGKLHSIYLGKELDIEKAQMRIADKERELLGLAPEPSQSSAVSDKGRIGVDSENGS